MKTVYTIRVIYKSGAQMDFDVTSFTIQGGRYAWEWHSGPKPILLGVDDVVAVYQLREREE